MNTNFPIRSYCHPVDAKIIRLLDAPVFSDACRKILETGTDVFLGQIMASAIPITEKNFPELAAILDDCCAILRIPKPYMVLTSQIEFNAFAAGNDQQNPVIILGSKLVSVLTENQLRFVIGHECGHIALGHMVHHTAASILTLFSKKIPVVGFMADLAGGYALKAWTRRSEISADRAGMLCCGDITDSKRALIQIACGFVDGATVDLDAYLQQSRVYQESSVLRRIGELTNTHPIIPRRLECLDLFVNSSLLYRICAEQPPQGVLDDRELLYKCEKVLRVI